MEVVTKIVDANIAPVLRKTRNSEIRHQLEKFANSAEQRMIVLSASIKSKYPDWSLRGAAGEAKNRKALPLTVERIKYEGKDALLVTKTKA